MGNDFSADFKDIWAKEQEEVFYKTNVGLMLADTSFDSDMRSGDVLNRTYRSSNKVQKHTRGAAVTIDDKTDTKEYLTVNGEFATGFYVDDFDKIQSDYDAAASYGKDDGMYLSNQMDSDILGEVANAYSTLDNASFGGTAGEGISLTTGNLLQIFSGAKKAIKKQNVSTDSGLVAVLSPEFEQVLVEYGAGKDTVGGDTVQTNGFIKRFMGFDCYSSNQLSNTALLSLATQPTDGDTVTVGGIVFTYKTTLGTTAGNVLIGASADAARLNLTTLINTPQTTTSTGVALTGDNLRTVQNQYTAVNDVSANTMAVTAKGVGSTTFSKVLTDATDNWTTAKTIQNNIFGVKGCTTLVRQKGANIQVKDVADKFGKNILNGVLYGYKTFADNAKKMVNVKIAASTF